MKLLLVSNMFPSSRHPNYGVFVENFIENFKNDEQIQIIGKAVIHGRGINLMEKIFKYFIFFSEVIWKGLRLDYDCVYVHYANHSLLPVRLLLLYKKKPTIVNFHGRDLFPENRFDRFLSRFSERVILNSRLIVAPSIYFSNEIINKYKLNADKVIVSPSAGINLNLFINQPKTQRDYLFLGYVGRIDYAKGWDLFIQLIHNLILEKYIVHGIMVGDGKFKEYLREQIFKTGLQDYIDLEGFLPQNELVSIYQDIDVLIFPSHRESESLGLVGLEAMACGTPVIGTDIGGIRTYLIDKFNGFLFERNSLKDLIDKTKKFYHLAPERKLDLADHAIQTAKNYEQNLVKQRLKSHLLKGWYGQRNTL